MSMMTIKSYKELIKLPTFDERFNYLKMHGVVGRMTYGSYRYLNQKFYASDIWKKTRRDVILRDSSGDYACDLGCYDHDIPDGILIYVHHIIPITYDDIVNMTDKVLNPDNLITTIKSTHDAIHYGDGKPLSNKPVIRFKNDTCPWKR